MIDPVTQERARVKWSLPARGSRFSDKKKYLLQIPSFWGNSLEFSGKTLIMNESKGKGEERIHMHMCTIMSTRKHMQAHVSTHPQDLLFLESPQKSTEAACWFSNSPALKVRRQSQLWKGNMLRNPADLDSRPSDNRAARARGSAFKS